MPPAEFEPAIPVIERPQNHALDRAATGSNFKCVVFHFNQQMYVSSTNRLKLCVKVSL